MKDFSQYKLNVKKSPYDKRDFRFKAIYKEIVLPEKTNNRDILLPVRDQGSQGSCAAMSAAAMKEWQEINDIDLNEYLSPQFVYNNREDTSQEGMTNRDLMKILQNKGICLEKTYPYGSTSKPSDTALREASLFVIKNYARIYSLNELKQALFIKGPCIIAVPVFNYTTRLWYQRPGDEFLGGHDMCVVDYDDVEKVLWIRNSWGTDFGESGYIKMPYEDFELAWEWWGTVDLDSVYPPDEPIDPIEPEKKCFLLRFLSWFKK